MIKVRVDERSGGIWLELDDEAHEWFGRAVFGTEDSHARQIVIRTLLQVSGLLKAYFQGHPVLNPPDAAS